MATIERTFLDWNRPAPEVAVEWLFELNTAGELDLSGHVIVTPGKRAGRVISAMLASRCLESRIVYSQPKWITPGEIVSVLAAHADRSGLQAATEQTRQLAYVHAMDLAGAEFIRPLIARYDPASGLAGRMAIARSLLQAQDEIAREGMRISEAIARAASFAGFDSEEHRWKVASNIQDRYETILGKWGCFDNPLFQLRLSRVEGTAPAIERLVLIGIADLQRNARDSIRNTIAACQSLVFSNPSRVDCFDDFGCVIPARWETPHADLQSDQVIITEDAREQARVVFGLIGSHAHRYAAQDMVIGVADDDVVPALEFESGLVESATVRDGAGMAFRLTKPGRLLELIALHLEEESWATLVAIVRNPDVSATVLADIAAAHDEVQAVTEQWRNRMGRRVEPSATAGVARLIIDEIDGWLMPLRGTERAGFRSWAEGLMEILKRIYGGIGSDPAGNEHKTTVEACVEIRNVALNLAESPSGSLFHCEGSEFVKLISNLLRSEKVTQRQDDDAVEMLGWLELLFDPAKVLIVTGMNDGCVPQTKDADPLLPNGLRAHLGLACDRRTFARDMYLLHALKHSREHISLIAGRRAFDGSPLKPSRLLFAESADTVVARLAEYSRFNAESLKPLTLARRTVRSGSVNGFKSCIVTERPPLSSMRVTAFKEYLDSPYLFYLRHVLGLQEQEDPSPELDARDFGVLLHDTLNDFGKSAVKDTVNASDIEEFLAARLNERCGLRFGSKPTGAVLLQMQSAGFRLRAFASHQAARRRAGWHIIETEWQAQRATLDVDGEPFGLRGRIDRIDMHDDGRISIWDYKSGDQAVDPGKDHGNAKKGLWRNLQLPLYRHLALELNRFALEDHVEFGYVLLPRDSAATAFSVADWDMSNLLSADESARNVVRDIRNGAFETLGKAKPGEGAIAGLCGIGQLGVAPPIDDDDEGGSAS